MGPRRAVNKKFKKNWNRRGLKNFLSNRLNWTRTWQRTPSHNECRCCRGAGSADL